MLGANDLNKEVVYHFFSILFSNVVNQWNLVILQDRQNSPRPLDSEGEIKNYLFYRVDDPITLQWNSKEIVEKDNKFYERTISQKQVNIVVNCLGKNSIDIANYFHHAINSNLGYSALRATIDNKVITLQYNNSSTPVDLTDIENTKFIQRTQFEVKLGYTDYEDFVIDTFNKLEVEEKVSDGTFAKPIIIRPQGE